MASTSRTGGGAGEGGQATLEGGRPFDFCELVHVDSDPANQTTTISHRRHRPMGRC